MRLLLVGYYGYGNLGDELLAGVAARIVQAVPATVQVLTPQLRRPLRLWTAIFSCDGIVFGGGSLFQDITGRGFTVLYYVGIALLGLCLRKKIFFIGHGMGPIKRPLNRLLLRYVLQRAEFISLRNRESFAFVQALGISRAILTNDLIFAEMLPKIKKKQTKKIKIVLSFRSGVPVNQLIAFCAQLHEHDLVVVPLQQRADELLSQQFKKYARVVDYDPEKIIREIATADFAVGMRLHFLILAASYAVPFIGIAYDPKVEGLCKHFHMPFVSNQAVATLPQLLKQELPKANHYRTKLHLFMERERRTAHEHVSQIQEAIRHAFR
jgi:polysaccharide pyruvyl transferase CsaB